MSGRPVVKIVADALSQHDEKHVVPTLLIGIRVGKRRVVGSSSNYRVIRAHFHRMLLTSVNRYHGVALRFDDIKI
jgi:hypothetical protein